MGEDTMGEDTMGEDTMGEAIQDAPAYFDCFALLRFVC
jgi:hypothetical protein